MLNSWRLHDYYRSLFYAYFTIEKKYMFFTGSYTGLFLGGGGYLEKSVPFGDFLSLQTSTIQPWLLQACISVADSGGGGGSYFRQAKPILSFRPQTAVSSDLVPPIQTGGPPPTFPKSWIRHCILFHSAWKSVSYIYIFIIFWGVGKWTPVGWGGTAYRPALRVCMKIYNHRYKRLFLELIRC